MYKYHNNNSLGLFTNDCTIRSIATATNNTWDDTYEHLSNIARLNGTMIDDRNFIQNYLDERYKRAENIPTLVGEVAAKYKDNIILVTMQGHIVCCKFGS